jgi:glucose-6-phosphate-specific signal transduction histidine kinase
MSERIRALGGAMSIAPGEFGGTRLEINLPIEEQLPARPGTMSNVEAI